MSHLINVENIYQKLITLNHYSISSKIYCEKRLIGSSKDQGKERFDSYWSWTKSIVCNSVLDCSIKLRVIQDILKDKQEFKLEEIDEKSIQGLKIGEVIKGKIKLTLRESCNKIIHATKVIPIWDEESKDINYKFWSGKVTLYGEHNKSEWELRLDTQNWTQAMMNYIDNLEEEEDFIYLGQDWF